MNFVWSSSYSVGVATIDEQHKPIIEILNELHKPNDVIDMDKVAKKSLDYTQKHFCFEEELMGRYNFGEAKEHKLQHDKFINMLNAYILNKNDSGAKSMAKMVLIRWFIDHITSNVMDKRLGKFLNGLGVH